MQRENGGGWHLLEFILFGDFVFAGFGCLPVELFRGELRRVELLEVTGRWRGKWGITLRLKRAFSSPDIFEGEQSFRIGLGGCYGGLFRRSTLCSSRVVDLVRCKIMERQQ